MLCRLYSWTESRFTIRNHSTVAVPGLIVSDGNFNISHFVHNRFCFLQVWCPTVFASSGHPVPLNFGLKNTLSYCMLKKMCNTARGASGKCFTNVVKLYPSKNNNNNNPPTLHAHFDFSHATAISAWPCLYQYVHDEKIKLWKVYAWPVKNP